MVKHRNHFGLPSWLLFEPDEIAAVDSVLRSGRVNYWTGDQCKLLERAWSDYHGRIYSLAMANGSLTLEVALRVLEVGKGDEVIRHASQLYHQRHVCDTRGRNARL